MASSVAEVWVATKWANLGSVGKNLNVVSSKIGEQNTRERFVYDGICNMFYLLRLAMFYFGACEK